MPLSYRQVACSYFHPTPTHFDQPGIFTLRTIPQKCGRSAKRIAHPPWWDSGAHTLGVGGASGGVRGDIPVHVPRGSRCYTAPMNRALAVALIALALCAGFVGGLAVPRSPVSPAQQQSSASPVRTPTPTREERINECYKAPASEGVLMCLRNLGALPTPDPRPYQGFR